jgi:fatty acid desaturase
MLINFKLLLEPANQTSLKNNDISVRDSMRVLPEFLQPMLTFLTGQALQEQKPWKLTAIHHLFLSFSFLLIGITLSSLAVIKSGFWLLLLIPAWICTISGTRSLEVVHLHQCSHNNWSGNKNIDRWLGTFISVLVISRSFDTYRIEHKTHHQLHKFLTLEDVPTEFLIQKIGLQPGHSKQELWQRLIFSLISPKVHIKFLLNRLAVCFTSPYLLHNTIALTFWINILTIVTIFNCWLIFGIAYLLPITFIFQISTILRLSVEHQFPKIDIYNNRDKIFVCRSTVAVFLGEKTPNSNLPLIEGIVQWINWWLRMIFVHLFFRVFVLQGDTVVHDYHHRHPGKDDWANAIFARQQEIEAGCPQYPEGYIHVYGFIQAVDAVLESISNLPHIEKLKVKSLNANCN